MSPFPIFLILLSTLFWQSFYVAAVDNPSVASTEFCYDEESCGQQTWGGSCQDGARQSPIDIRTDVLNRHRRDDGFMYYSNKYRSSLKQNFYGQNNGHSVQFELTSVTSELSSDLYVFVGNEGMYKFAQMHFHWGNRNSPGSEHTIDGHRFEMELHMVHYKEKFANLADAVNSKEPNAVAVMGIFFEVGPNDNHELQHIVNILPNLLDEGSVTQFEIHGLTLAHFIPGHGELDVPYVRYPGSLTTPNCDEVVEWTVYPFPLYLSRSQMEEFWAIRNGHDVSSFNYRHTQPPKDRKPAFYNRQ